ncbi:MAG: response regulator [Frankiaceae bacterium]
MAHVLVVDDDPDILMLVEMRLNAAGHQVLAVGSGPEALAIVETRGLPDVAVLDISLPGMDGFDLLKALQSRPGGADLPAIFLSARVLPTDVAAGRALGATYLTKPFIASALLSSVQRAVDGAKLQKARGW